MRGFTLVEVMVVVVIISLLASMSVFTYQKYLDHTRIKMTRTVIAETARNLELTKMTTKAYPASLGELSRDPPVDGWERPLLYSRDGSGFKLGSLGEDGVAGGEGVDADLWY